MLPDSGLAKFVAIIAYKGERNRPESERCYEGEAKYSGRLGDLLRRL
jgi:hypothetical protein